MLNPEFKEKWATALESDEYKQATGVLYNGEGYCCLGVACVVAGATFTPAETGFGREYLAPKIGDKVLSDTEDTAVLSQSFRNEIGLDWASQGVLWKMNDNGSTFPEIADYIRKNL